MKKHTRFLMAIVLVVIAFCSLGWITRVGNWRVENSEIVNPSITVPDAAYLAVTTAGYTTKTRTMGLGCLDTTTVTMDHPGSALPGVDLAGAAPLGSSEGYITLDADADSVNFTVQLPETLILAGAAGDLLFQFDIAEGVDTPATMDWAVAIYPYGAVAETEALVSDSITVSSEAGRGWVTLHTLASGIGAVSGLDVGDRLYFNLSPLADTDTGTIYGVRMKYRVGLQATE